MGVSWGLRISAQGVEGFQWGLFANVCWKVFLPIALINIFGVAIWTVIFN
mgnify:CR=1 FL=1